jgi:hypothetical protein
VWPVYIVVLFFELAEVNSTEQCCLVHNIFLYLETIARPGFDMSTHYAVAKGTV